MRVALLLLALSLSVPLLAGTAAADQEPCYHPTEVHVYYCPYGWGNPYAFSVCGWDRSYFMRCLV